MQQQQKTSASIYDRAQQLEALGLQQPQHLPQQVAAAADLNPAVGNMSATQLQQQERYPSDQPLQHAYQTGQLTHMAAETHPQHRQLSDAPMSQQYTQFSVSQDPSQATGNQYYHPKNLQNQCSSLSNQTGTKVNPIEIKSGLGQETTQIECEPQIQMHMQTSTQATADLTAQQAAVPRIIQVGQILQLICAKGDQVAYSNAVITPFHSHEIPNINILLYYVVLSQNAGLHEAQAPAVLVLMERLCQTAAQKGFPIIINSFTIHRLILTTVLITSKMFNDTYYTNQFIAQVGGVSLANINELERFFMSMIDWNLFIKPEEFEQYEKGLEMFQGHEATQQQAGSAVQSAQPSPVLSFQSVPNTPSMESVQTPSQQVQQPQTPAQLQQLQMQFQIQQQQQMLKQQFECAQLAQIQQLQQQQIQQLTLQQQAIMIQQNQNQPQGCGSGQQVLAHQDTMSIDQLQIAQQLSQSSGQFGHNGSALPNNSGGCSMQTDQMQCPIGQIEPKQSTYDQTPLKSPFAIAGVAQNHSAQQLMQPQMTGAYMQHQNIQQTQMVQNNLNQQPYFYGQGQQPRHIQ